jgi:hypothetical protein
MASEDFYQSLPALAHFTALADPDAYQTAPPDWYVLMTDVAGSTTAIERGQYKAVNVLGASSIMAVLNAIAPLDIPFVFGGDGAVLLVPPSALQRARDALLGLKTIAHQAFGLTLRVGVVPVAALTPETPVKVAKFRLTETYSQANFTGGGITYAEFLIKTDPLYRLDLEGNPAQYHPIAINQLQVTLNPAQLWAETKARSPRSKRWIYLAKAYLETLLGWGLMRLGLTAGGVDWGRYRQEVWAASDCQKLDDCLRMVIAGTPAQTQRLTNYLEHRYQQGQIAYGLHVSNRALMTCLILNRRNCHFHLVDSADGGYALAAKQLKARLRG